MPRIMTSPHQDVVHSPDLFIQLLPGAEVRVHTGPGSDDQENLYWALGEPVWGQASAVVLDNQAGDPVAVLPLGE